MNDDKVVKKITSDIFFINEQHHWIKKKLHITTF